MEFHFYGVKNPNFVILELYGNGIPKKSNVEFIFKQKSIISYTKK